MAKLRKHALKILSKKVDEPIMFVDIGARGGVTGLRDIAQHVAAIGVEPNPYEKNKILSGHYQSDVRGYWEKPNYLDLQYFWGAISKNASTRDLLILKHHGASGFKIPNTEALDFRYFLNMTQKKTTNKFSELYEVEEIINVPCISGDALIEHFNIDHIDYLKIDVEGDEYEVLESFSKLSTGVSFIKVEVCFIPFKKDQRLFDDIFRLLIDSGFAFISLSGIHKGYSRELNPKYYNKRFGFKGIEATWMSCDAYFIKIPENIQLRNRLATVLAHEGFMDQAFSCINSDTKTQSEILKYLDRYIFLSFFDSTLNFLNKYKFGIWLKKLTKAFLRIGN
jgi:FkbM family methyltransferase